MVKKLSLAAGLILILVFVGLTTYVNVAIPALPADTDAILDRIMKSELPEFVRGRTGYARSGEIALWYEIIQPDVPEKGTVLLLMGIGNDALGWPVDFLDSLVGRGYQVIRYDYRGTGLSSWVEDWDRGNPYTLEDMANDSIAVLDALGIEKVHLVGISLGGMVAQQITIDHPDRVVSLTSIMSSCDIGDPYLPPISTDIVRKFLLANVKYGLVKTERNTVKLHLTSLLIMMGDTLYPLDVEGIAQRILYN